MKQLKSYIPAVALTILIPLLSLITPDKLPDVSTLHFPGMDKVIHILMYGALTIAWAFGVSVKTQTNLRRMLTLAFLTALYGLLLEVCQFLFTSSRLMEMLDAVANLAGALVAAMVFYAFCKFKLANSSPSEGTQPIENSKSEVRSSE